MKRTSLAAKITSGLAGWHQLQTAQNLNDLSGEDTARSVVAQIINAQGQFLPATSQLPANWGTTKKRVDIALLGRSSGAVVWYGAIEVKWPRSTTDTHQIRQNIVQDAMRLAFITTQGIGAKFLVLGGGTGDITKLFDTPHPNASNRETRRQAFTDLFSRDLSQPDGHLTFDDWSVAFPDAGDRVPSTTFNGFNGKLKTELVALSQAAIGSSTVGSVFVWQCSRTRGTAPARAGNQRP